MRRFEFVDGKSNKFWEAKTEGPKLMVRFGRIGGTWQESDKLLADAEKANAEMEKLIREKTRKGYLEVGGKPEVKVLAKAVAKKAKPKETKSQSMEATISPAERKAKAQKVLLMFANGQWELAHNILETAQDEEWLFEQLLNGCKIEKGKPIPSNAIKKAFKKDEKSSPVLAMLNIMLCNPSSSKALKSFKFEKLKETLWLHDLTSLSDGAAEALSKCKGDLLIDKLASLSDSSGHVALVVKLASQKGKLYLRGLKSLSDAGAEALSKHEGELLFLDGLSSLSDIAVVALSKQKGELILGLTSLSAGAAEALSKHEGVLKLWGLTSLSTIAAEALSKHKGELCFQGLTSLSDAAAKALSKHKGDMVVGSLRTLSDSPGHIALATKLASQETWFFPLGNLTSLSDGAAEALSKRKGYISFYYMTSLSDGAAEALSKHEGELYLGYLESLSYAGAEALSKHKGDLDLRNLYSLSEDAAEALSKHEGELKLRGSLKQKVEKYKKQGRKK